jgi:hypothetical protein
MVKIYIIDNFKGRMRNRMRGIIFSFLALILSIRNICYPCRQTTRRWYYLAPSPFYQIQFVNKITVLDCAQLMN